MTAILNPLIPKLTGQKIKKVVLIGNGAVINGNMPLVEVFASGGSEDAKIYSQLNPSVALAILAADIQTHKNRYAFDTIRTLNGIYPQNTNSDAQTQFAQVNKWREDIGLAFVKAKREQVIKLNNDLEKYIPDLASNSVGIITTNWDDLLIDRNLSNLIQLHGSASRPNSIILPTEKIEDDFSLTLIKLCIPSNVDINEICSAYRNSEDQCFLQQAEDKAIEWMKNANELVLFGSAINAYDCELFQALRRWNNLRSKGFPQTRVNGAPQLVIVNPNKDHAETGARLLRVREYLWINPIHNTQEHISFTYNTD